MGRLTPYYKDKFSTIFNGDSKIVLAEMKDNLFDACITDPPYEIGFMGRQWDSNGIAFDVDLWRQVYRTMKPGAHLAAFGSPRAYHRMAVAIEDAGFEIRDSLMWLFGSGFPKGQDISKAIDKAAGATREVVSVRKSRGKSKMGIYGDFSEDEYKITAPATPDAKEWDGWNTSLKPAFEPIVLARKPIAENTVVNNVLTHRTGALNVGATRVEAGEQGLWPATVLLDDDAATLLNKLGSGAARFFYTAKTSTSEREAGLLYEASEPGRQNKHLTVKPLELIRWLVRLLTPPHGRVLDPFFGSGSLRLACMAEAKTCVGVELEEDHCRIAAKRG